MNHIVKYIKKKHNVMIGERTAEDLKINIGCVYPKIQDSQMEIRGRDLTTGLPKNIIVHSSEMLEALIEPAMHNCRSSSFCFRKNTTRIISRYK